MFTRPCYLSLYPKVLEIVRDGEYCIVTGTPGIGKSFFGYYTIPKLLDEGVTVIHIDLGWKATNLYLPNAPSEAVRKVLEEYAPSILQEGSSWKGRFDNNNHELTHDSRILYEELTRLVGEVVVVLDHQKIGGRKSSTFHDVDYWW